MRCRPWMKKIKKTTVMSSTRKKEIAFAPNPQHRKRGGAETAEWNQQIEMQEKGEGCNRHK